MKIFVVLASVVILSGCATDRVISSGPDGKPIHFIKCGSAVLDACYAKAAEVCPQGYNMIDRTANPNGMVIGGATYSRPSIFGASSFVAGPHNFAIECK